MCLFFLSVCPHPLCLLMCFLFLAWLSAFCQLASNFLHFLVFASPHLLIPGLIPHIRLDEIQTDKLLALCIYVPIHSLRAPPPPDKPPSSNPPVFSPPEKFWETRRKVWCFTAFFTAVALLFPSLGPARWQPSRYSHASAAACIAPPYSLHNALHCTVLLHCCMHCICTTYDTTSYCITLHCTHTFATFWRRAVLNQPGG